MSKSAFNAENEKTGLLDLEMRGKSNFNPSAEDQANVPVIDRLPFRQSNYVCCLGASLLTLITIYLSYIYAWELAPDYEVLSVPHGSKIQLKSLHYGKFIRVEDDNVIITEDIPRLHSATFELFRADSSYERIEDDNWGNRCFKMRSMSDQWLTVSRNRDSSSEKSLHTLELTDSMAEASIFAAVVQDSFDSKHHKHTRSKSRWPMALTTLQLKVCNEDIWLKVQADTDVVSANSGANEVTTLHLDAGDSDTVAHNDTTTLFQLGIVKHIHGVNLGGWFIPEMWMVPELYANTTANGWGGLCQLVAYNRTLAELRMDKHLSSWITESDIQQISSLGYNSVRVPLGYWNVLSDPYEKFVPGNVSVSLQYLDWLMEITQRYNLSVLLDLHGAPGSQNGQDHSGCGWSVEWDSVVNIAISLDAIEVLITRYSTYDNLLGIELLNEPSKNLSTLHHQDLLDYYREAYRIIRAQCATCIVVFNELYPLDYSLWQQQGEALLEPDYYNVVLDFHLYNWQEPYTQISAEAHIANATGWGELIKQYNTYYPVVVGEWCMSTGVVLQVGQPFVDASLRSFKQAYGWYAWNWKIGDGNFPEWNVQFESEQPDGLRIVK